MSNIDHLDLDGYTLRTFLTVLDETSVSRAAERLGVSHSLSPNDESLPNSIPILIKTALANRGFNH